MTYILIAVGTVLFAYLIGSVNFAVIIAKIFSGKDVRNLGSGNAGTTNVLRTVGFLPGLLTFVLDALKGFVACFAGKLVFEKLYELTSNDIYNFSAGSYLCLVFVMLGHIYPIFFGFRGGKAVAVSVGTYAVCCYPAILLGLLVFAIMLFVSRIVSLSSLAATVTVVATSILFMDFTNPSAVQIVCTVTAGIMVFLKHKDNIIRLKNGEEKKITIGRKGKNG